MPKPMPPEIIEVDPHDETVGCDGGGGALGHPMVYYSFGTTDAVVCGYCGRRFVKPQKAAESPAQPDSAAAAGDQGALSVKAPWGPLFKSGIIHRLKPAFQSIATSVYEFSHF